MSAVSKTAKRRKPIAAEDVVFNILNYTFFILFAIACAFPFYYLFINTISDNDLVSSGKITIFPQGIHFTNYISLLNVNDLGTSFLVSVARTVIGTVLMVMASALVGYLVTKRTHRCQDRYNILRRDQGRRPHNNMGSGSGVHKELFMECDLRKV